MISSKYPSNAENAKKLFKQFPGEIPVMVKGLAEYCEYVISHQEQIKKNWPEFHFTTFDFWIDMAKEAANAIKEHESTIDKNARVFTFHLFESRCVFFVIHYLKKYGDKVSNEFGLAARVMF